MTTPNNPQVVLGRLSEKVYPTTSRHVPLKSGLKVGETGNDF